MAIVERETAVVFDDAEAFGGAIEIGVENSQRGNLAVGLVGSFQQGSFDGRYFALGWHMLPGLSPIRIHQAEASDSPTKVWHSHCCNLISPPATRNLTVRRCEGFRHSRYNWTRFTYVHG